jgi:hypothetical protein
VSWIKKSVVCLHAQGYEVSLRFKGTYEVIPDRNVEKYDLLRVVDESGEDYHFFSDSVTIPSAKAAWGWMRLGRNSPRPRNLFLVDELRGTPQ